MKKRNAIMCANAEIVEPDLKSVSCGVQDEGPPPPPQSTNAHATSTAATTTITTTTSTEELVATGNNNQDETAAAIKKRKTRRGKSKRRNPNPYTKLSWQQRKNICNRNKFRANILNHALAPFNSNQFLMEDHGDLQELDDKLNKSDGVAAGTSTLNPPPPRTRDSSFSVDSEGDFYSSPEDEEEFLTKEFDTAYENLQAERLQSMSKAELIEEYLQLENKVELLTKRLRGKSTTIAAITNTNTNTNEDDANKDANTPDVQEEINKLIVENDELRRENEHLRSGMCRTASSFSSSMDSESDSSSSTCNSSSTASNQDEVMKEDVLVENGVHDSSLSPTSTSTSTINDKSPTLSIEPSSNPSLIDNVL